MRAKMPTQEHTAQLLTMPQAAERLTMSKRTLERLMAAHEFPQPVRFTSRMVRVLASDVDAYLVKKVTERRALA
jgi:excisionase family DNA binding protein